MALNGPEEMFTLMELCTYKGAVLLVEGSAISGGRKDSKKEFVNSDLQSIEDLGLRNRTYVLNGVTQTRRDVNGNVVLSYKNARDNLLRAVESGGPGVLIHPWLGKLENMVARSFTLDETNSNMGVAKWSITFEVSNSLGQPISEFNSPALIDEKQREVDVQLQSFITSDFDTTGTSNAVAAASKLTEMTDKLNDASKTAIRKAELVTAAVDEFNTDIIAFQDSVNALVAVPTDLAQATANIFRKFDGIFATAIDTYTGFLEMLEFRPLDIEYEGTATYLSIQAAKNATLVNETQKSYALSYAYLAASQLTFETVSEIETVAEQLEDQYQLILNSSLDKSVIDAVTEQRAATVELFSQQKLTARQIVPVRTNLTTFRLLSYKYYGSSDDGETLALLNGEQIMLAEGEVEVLSP